ncbi:MAG: class I SAM-dependent methyltransferase [Thermoanaerobaculia bacterium]|nr:class I SAM-dependent methyltransferase [Thermoanaerobaculia bacterium]
MTHPRDDPYSRVDYRRMVAWPERIARERPLLESFARRAPDPSVVDLGCGTGEHALFLASLGLRTVGVDRSETQLGKARELQDAHPPHGPRVLLGDVRALDELTDERFGAAIALGNGLPSLEDADLDRALTALARRLVPGGGLLIQILNYERILGRGVRHLPLNFRGEPGTDGEAVFLRLMTAHGDRHVLFHPTTLALHPGSEPPVTVEATKEVRLRAWRRTELEARLEANGFSVEAVWGDMTGGRYEAAESSDLVVAAMRP